MQFFIIKTIRWEFIEIGIDFLREICYIDNVIQFSIFCFNFAANRFGEKNNEKD